MINDTSCGFLYFHAAKYITYHSTWHYLQIAEAVIVVPLFQKLLQVGF